MMRYLMCGTTLSLLLIVSPLTSGEKPAAAPIEISWHGQSFFTIKTSKGTTIAIDPHAIPEYGRLQGVRADIILMSHNHNDHTQIGVIDNFRDKVVRIIAGLKSGGL